MHGLAKANYPQHRLRMRRHRLMPSPEVALLVQTYGLHLGNRGEAGRRPRTGRRPALSILTDAHGFDSVLLHCRPGPVECRLPRRRPVLFNDQDMIFISNVWALPPANDVFPCFSLFSVYHIPAGQGGRSVPAVPEMSHNHASGIRRARLEGWAVYEPQLLLGMWQPPPPLVVFGGGSSSDSVSCRSNLGGVVPCCMRALRPDEPLLLRPAPRGE